MDLLPSEQTQHLTFNTSSEEANAKLGSGVKQVIARQSLSLGRGRLAIGACLGCGVMVNLPSKASDALTKLALV